MFRRIWNKARINRKLMVINLLTTGVTLLLTCSALMVAVFFSFRESLVDSLSAQAKVLAGSSSAPLLFNDPKQAAEDLRALKASPNITRAIIYDKRGGIFAEYLRDGQKKDLSPPPRVREGYRFSADYLHLFHGITLDGERVGTIYLRSDLWQLHSLMLQTGVIAALTTLIVFIFASLMLTRLQGAITGPVFSLVHTMRTVSSDRNYALRAEVAGEDEMGVLAKVFNEMLEQTQESDRKLRIEIAERKRAEEETRRLNEQLELKVEERTGQLLAAQEELVRKEKLATLGQLSGSVGHELRNPLGVMNNALYYLNTVMTDVGENVKEYLDIIGHEINNCQRIITDLLDFARVKTPQSRAIAAGELVADSIRRCAVPESVRLRTEIPETLPMVVADPAQMVQVFENLITNAVQAMPEGGSLRISAREVESEKLRVSSSNQQPAASAQEVSSGKLKVESSNMELGVSHFDAPGSDIQSETFNLKPDADFVEISVEDSGEGISPENMKKLFQPLFTTKARGIGLGLTVCRNLTEANGGRINVESRPGEGTIFAVLLPAERSLAWEKK
ncbi:MAG TPA: ATP-binding protein [Geobacteraceae bacterium]|nr:ATP-binding protein [Geobacteraceae bacterium]